MHPPFQDFAWRNKIERLWLTIRTQMLPLVAEQITLEQLNAQLAEWMETYHRRVHQATGEPPLERYLRHVTLLRSAPEDLREHFRTVVRRKVDADRAVSLAGKLYEAPVGLIGQTVKLRYHPEDSARIEVFFEQRSYGFLRELNPHVNSRVRRLSGRQTEIDPSAQRPDDTAGGTDPKPPYRGGQLFGEPHR